MKRRVQAWLRNLWHDEQGDLIQNLGWVVAVSLGAVAVGGLVYAGIRAYGTKVQSRIDGIDGGTITNPTY